jgi:hypothetical protein
VRERYRIMGGSVAPALRLDHARLRNIAAIIAMVSGLGQVAALWLLPTDTTLLITGVLGGLYLLLSLGLFGVSRLSLFVAILGLSLRAWFGWSPLPIAAWEYLRAGADAAIALLCIPVLWDSLHYRPQASETPGAQDSPAAEGRHGGVDLA